MTEHGDKSCIGCAELPKSERALEERSKNAHDNGSLAQIEHKHDPRKSHTEAALEVCKSGISASVLAYVLFVHCTGKGYGGIPSCDKICTYRGGDVEQGDSGGELSFYPFVPSEEKYFSNSVE